MLYDDTNVAVNNRKCESAADAALFGARLDAVGPHRVVGRG